MCSEVFEPGARGVVRSRPRKRHIPTFSVGTVADPTKQNVLKVIVGRATPSISLRAVRLSNGVPACSESISGCGLARDHTPRPGLKPSLVAAGGLHKAHRGGDHLLVAPS